MECSVGVDLRNKLALKAREENYKELSTQEIQHCYPFYGWVQCTVENENHFEMFLGGLDDMVAAKFFYNKTYEKGSLSQWCSLLPSAAAVMDIGAHTGVYSLTAASINPDIPIVAIEPVSQNINRLHLNATANQFNKIQTIQAVVTSASGRCEIAVPNMPGYMTQGAKIGSHTKGSFTATIQGLSVDDAFNFGDKGPDLIKIDTEGHEAEVIIGMRKHIASYRPTFLIECNDVSASQKMNSISNILQNYVIFVVNEIDGTLTKTKNFEVLKHPNKTLVREKMNRLLVHKSSPHLKILKESAS